MYKHASLALSRAVPVLVLALIAGLTAPLAAPAGATPDFAFERIAGKDRFDTARVISGQQGKSDLVVLARGDVFADALAGTYLAGINNAPILLTRSDGLPAETDQAINDAGATRVIILGGVNAISPAVEEHLRAKGLAVERVGGVDRYETSALVARHGGPAVLGSSDGLRTAIVVSGANFPDALSGGPVSYFKHFPTFLTTPGAASPALLAAIDALEIRQVIIIGGPTAVAAGVESTLRSRGLNVNRLFGQDRSGTSVAVARIAIERFGFRASHLNVARGDDFADALAFTAHAGRDTKAAGATPLYLTISSVVAGRELVDAVRAQAAQLAHGHIVGGLMAISQEVEDELTRAARAGSAHIDLDYTTVVPGGKVRGEIGGDNIGSLSVSGCGLRGLTVREGAGAFEFEIPQDQPTGGCTLVFTTNFTNGPVETERHNITVTDPEGTDTSPTPTTQPGNTTPTTAPGTTTPTTAPGSTTPTTQPSNTTPTTQPSNTTPTTQPTTPTTQPPVPAADVADFRADATGGNASGTDIHQITFVSPMASTTDEVGSSYVIRGAGGNTASVECSVNAICFLLPAGEYNGRTVVANQVMRVRLLETPRKLTGGDAPIAYPVTLTEVTNWDKAAGGGVELGGDSTGEAAPVTPARSVGYPTFTSATESSERLTVAFDRAVLFACGGSSNHHQQFAFTSPTGTYNPTSAVAESGSIQLTFTGSGIAADGGSDGELMYGDPSSAEPDCGDVIDLSGNPVRNLGPVSTQDA